MNDSGSSDPESVQELAALRIRVAELERETLERRRTIQVLRETEQRFRKIFDHSNDGILIIELTRDEILEVNPKACAMLRYSREEILSTPMSAILPHEMPHLLASSRSAFASNGWTIEVACLTKNGETLPAEMSASPIEVAGRTCLIAMLRDVSQRKRAEAALSESDFSEIIGSSPAMKRVFQSVQWVTGTDSTVLLTGETGTGKELIARAIHNGGRRRNNLLVKVNCAALPPGLIESELFGHEKGAFTGALSRKIGRFELAHQGTIFLDEIGDLSLELQSKLLRILQEGEFERVGGFHTHRVDVRVIAATNRDLEKAIQEEKFRPDLYYRLNVFPIRVPPLRERPSDIKLLLRHFVAKYSKKLGKKVQAVPQKTMDALLAYPWPGNVRELENVIERAFIISQDSRLELGEWLPSPVSPGGARFTTLDEHQREYILQALEFTGWQVSGKNGAAVLLAVKPTTLEAKMKKLGIRRK